MSSQESHPGTTGQTAEDFGANAWLVDELYKQYIEDKTLVDESWWPVLENYQPSPESSAGPVTPAEPESLATAVANAAAATAAAPPTQPVAITETGAQPVAKTTNVAPKSQPIPADAPSSDGSATMRPEKTEEDVVTPLRGMAKTLASNMDASLTVPTATSVRTIPAKLLIDNRIVINNHLKRTRGGKVSFTHLIAWALVETIKTFPSQNVFYQDVDGKPSVVSPAHLNLGIAIDIPKPDGSRSLLVPSIKQAETLNFRDFLEAYEDLVRRARENKLTPADFEDTTISLTNPGGIGTVHSVPRLMKGQGCIIGAGALEYPAEFQGSSEKTLVELGIGKTVTLTSTYDHRVIQGAGSGEFLKLVHERLIGGHSFYNRIFAALRIPYEPIHWAEDLSVGVEAVDKTARVQELINAFRVRGHLMADIDPLEYHQRSHPDLEIENHGLTFWDLDREFVTGGIGGRHRMKLREILGVLRDSYCRKIGVEYMHIQDPEERLWIREQVEVTWEKPSHDEQMRILSKLNEAEAFETFLQTKYVGQKRFSLEGGESVIALLDAMLLDAAEDGVDCVAIGMAHRGRLNVLSNIAGKTYGQIFLEFEGAQTGVRGSGDVKYHLGTEGIFVSPTGDQVPVYLAANPSHLEAVNGVLEGIVRAKQDRQPIGSFLSIPVLIHGDAAMAGQGVVYETLQMAQLRGYRTGGTIHIIVNNQVGFTTLPQDARSGPYASDVGKATQTPIFHVNGDDPESVVRVAQLAYAYRQKFHRDVIIDLIAYRRRGHNEGDDPSMTQPLMYNLIEAKRSVRQLYAESLVGRGDITEEEFELAKQDFQNQLEQAFSDTHEAQTNSTPVVSPTGVETSSIVVPRSEITTSVSEAVIHRIGDAFANKPEGFTVHSKLEQLIQKRVEMTRNGEVDWGFGEILALGSLLMEGTAVRFAGQDARRGTFVQRHAVFHDRVNGQEWLPLLNLSEDQARFWIYDSFLSEYAALAFEYGYSVEREDALVLWEAQFGDFANGAQTVIDEFVSSAEQKWGQHSSVVMLLPHGYEGQGPDHSSARIERYLQLCAEDNITVARPSTPASYFHLLRTQAYARPRRPLIVFTPKSMLRLRGATSDVQDFTSGRFLPVIDDASISAKHAVKRVILVSGKTYYDLRAGLEKTPSAEIALVRIEQFYPRPLDELNQILGQYPDAELVWVQDEPENQGAWPFIALEVAPHLGGRAVRVICRDASAAPSTGLAKVHAEEQEAIVRAALSLTD